VTPIKKLLIANRGEIARRIMRTAREMSLATVAVFSEPDAGAPFVAEADEAVLLPGATAAETYLQAGLIVAAARRTGADAVHPGYGFLSENAAFALACRDAGLTFVGPSPQAIEIMGSKVEAKRLMVDAGVPVLPGVTIGEPPSAQIADVLETVGLPLIVKAAFGGGGRGMRVVERADELASALASAQREAAAAFGDGTVFVERFVVDPRHVEVQIFGDSAGTLTHLFERECSIQRRHQKVIEEAPSPAVDAGLRERICADAVLAAKAIEYVGAGTVEFVVDRTGRYFFLEVNTRLQVEHPVTEMITGLDLVRLQLEIAQGIPLPPSLRPLEPKGHAIEARLYAEDVAAGFMPTSGTLDRFRLARAPGVRVDSGYEDGSTVTTFYDAMLAKVIAWAPTRGLAAERLSATLARSEIHGVTTNRDLLVATLRHPEFLAGKTDTGFYTRHDPGVLAAQAVSEDAPFLHAVAAAAAARARRSGGGPTPPAIPAGWRNVGRAAQPTVFRCGGREIEVLLEHDRATARTGDELATFAVRDACSDAVELDAGGLRRRFRVHAVGEHHHVDSVVGSTTLTEVPRHPVPAAAVAVGSLLAPLPGSVVDVHVQVGDSVDAGAPILTMEAMKMEHSVSAPHAGTVTRITVAVGDQLTSGTLLAIVEAGP
jgi:acetyl/propionyl-CoA carboxylase alpha subunit